MAAGVVPQSSCSFRPMAPASTCWHQRLGPAGVALAQKPRFIGKASAAFSIVPCASGPGVQVVAKRAGGRAGAAADHRGHAAHQRFLDLLRADEVDVRVDAAGGDDQAFARNDLGARADDDVHAGLTSGLPALPMRRDAPGAEADVGLHDAPVVEDQRVGDDVSTASIAPGPLMRWLWPMPSRTVLPPPNFTSSP
jgi:hypothetical protein